MATESSFFFFLGTNVITHQHSSESRFGTFSFFSLILFFFCAHIYFQCNPFGHGRTKMKWEKKIETIKMKICGSWEM